MVVKYFPDDLDEQADWYTNFNTAFQPVATSLGFTLQETTDISNDCLAAAWMLDTVRETYEKLYNEVSGWVQTILKLPNGAPNPDLPTIPAWPTMPGGVSIVPGINARRILWVDKCKASPLYTPDVIGVALRTEPTGTPFDPNTWQAIIRSLECTGPDQVRIKMAKASGAIDANAIYSRIAGAGAMVKVGTYTQATVTLNTPNATPGQPEEREYEIRSVIKDAEIGLASDIHTVIVRG